MASKNTSVRLHMTSLLSIIGAGSGIYLSNHYYALKSGTQGFKSLCNVSDTMNCDVVALHRLAEVFGGIPLSSFVAGWFVALLLLTLCARMDGWKKDVIAIGTVMSALASVYSLILLYVMATQIKTFCLFCLVIDAVNFALLGLFLSMKEGPLFAGFDRGKLKSFAGMILVPMFVMVVLLRSETPKQEAMPMDETEANVQSVLQSKVETFSPFPENQIIGPKDAPITIVEFSDFQCPFCRRGAYILNSVLNRFPTEVRIVFRGFPLDSKCNTKGGMHPHACALSRATYCAGEQGKFEEMYQEIFDHQDSLSGTSGEEFAKSLGLDETKFKECADSERAKKSVASDLEEGYRLNVASTPTFFVNGHRVDGAYPYEVWERVIQGLLKK